MKRSARFSASVAIAVVILVLLAPRSIAQGRVAAVSKPPGDILYQQSCAKCHSSPAASNRAPDLKALMKLSPETIYSAITTGAMATAAQQLSAADKQVLASYLGGRPLDLTDAGSAKRMSNHCEANAPIENISSIPAWNGWGVTLANTRFENAQGAGLTAQQVPQLKLKWAFGFPNGDTSFGQPSIVGGRVFVGSDIGYFYAINADTGCVYWSYRAQATVRTAAIVGPVTGHGATNYAVYFGDFRGNVYALDASTGKPLWIRNVINNNYIARLSAGFALYKGRLYIPVSSSEEVFSADPSYPCCSFRGSVVALDANTGRLIWKSYVIPEAPKPVRKNSRGVQLYAPAGGAVWNSPTIDAERQLLYVGTGDALTEPAPKTTDAIVALDLKTGKMVWSFQAVKNDAWMVGCVPTATENCPKNLGPDHDIGASPILVKMPDGHRLLLALPKSGTIFALDPDRKGALVWKFATTETVAPNNGQLALGGASDGRNLYVALEDGTAVAIDLASGKRKWLARLESSDDLGEPTSNGENRTKAGLRFGQSAAVSAIPGVVFTGGWDGIMRALSTSDGQVIWQFNTARAFNAVNGVPAKGGSMGGPGPTVANGVLYVPSGYAAFGGGMPGNVLLALSPGE
ncbi:MAG TPA: PQQ-binding-like beta-propeller repeat protein [Candidatus Acidoferrales bacterium]